MRFSLLQGPRFAFPSSFQRGRLSWGSIPFSTLRFASYTPEVPSSSFAHASGFSPFSRAFFWPIFSRLISSRKRSWGSPFRGFSSGSCLETHRFKVPLLSLTSVATLAFAGCLGLPLAKAGSTSGFCILSEFVLGAATWLEFRPGRSPPGFGPP
jgi:hypothetical protein